jgi:hypothetical protein
MEQAAPLHPGQRLPTEFLGRARAFRSAVAATDAVATRAIDRITEPLRARFQRHPVPRWDALREAARLWRETVPAAARLGLEIEVERKRLRIDELRVTAADFRLDGWDEIERGVSIILLGLIVAPRQLSLGSPTLAYVSLHALGRRFQRGWATGDAAVLADLSVLAAAPPGDGEFSVQVAGGAWVGMAGPVRLDGREERTLVVRSFLAR